MLSLGKIQELMAELKDWSLESNAIVKEYQFESFKEALGFVNRVGEIAEKSNHHPDIMISFTTVRLTLTTHEAGGLSEKDFAVAKDIDAVEEL